MYDIDDDPVREVMTLREANDVVRSFSAGDEVWIGQDGERCHGYAKAVFETTHGRWAIDLYVPDSWYTDGYISSDLMYGEVALAHRPEDVN